MRPDVKLTNEFNLSMTRLGYVPILTSLEKNWLCAISKDNPQCFLCYDVDRASLQGTDDAEPAWSIRNLKTNRIIKRYWLRDQAINDLLKFELCCLQFCHEHDTVFNLFDYTIEVGDRYDVYLNSTWLAAFSCLNDCIDYMVSQQKIKFNLD